MLSVIHAFNLLWLNKQQLLLRFLDACQSGNLSALAETLSDDVTAWTDGGDKSSAALRPIVGLNMVMRYCLGIIEKPACK
ncbi:hypothetical protein [Dictyobacter aurantiacus]|uniref:Uncharacterized protein n=1 Tax=Dictyobacter aurantiacus TaxID=1936993 RepID=A0A401ZRM2_9CHLR|nr:hypothetical protein [Dictyobacter aurantiacus]GCE09446.1 hypothetical protein KDAU_67750 [Dictyobacter aurantiacus]